LSFVINIGKT